MPDRLGGAATQASTSLACSTPAGYRSCRGGAFAACQCGEESLIEFHTPACPEEHTSLTNVIHEQPPEGNLIRRRVCRQDWRRRRRRRRAFNQGFGPEVKSREARCGGHGRPRDWSLVAAGEVKSGTELETGQQKCTRCYPSCVTPPFCILPFLNARPPARREEDGRAQYGGWRARRVSPRAHVELHRVP